MTEHDAARNTPTRPVWLDEHQARLLGIYGDWANSTACPEDAVFAVLDEFCSAGNRAEIQREILRALGGFPLETT